MQLIKKEITTVITGLRHLPVFHLILKAVLSSIWQ